jgi:hypothetical protein
MDHDGPLHQFLAEPIIEKEIKPPVNPSSIDTSHLGCQRSKQLFVNQHKHALPRRGYRTRQYPPTTKKRLAKWTKSNFQPPLQEAWKYHASSTDTYQPQEWHAAKSHAGTTGKLKHLPEYRPDSTALVFFGPPDSTALVFFGPVPKPDLNVVVEGDVDRPIPVSHDLTADTKLDEASAVKQVTQSLADTH